MLLFRSWASARTQLNSIFAMQLVSYIKGVRCVRGPLPRPRVCCRRKMGNRQKGTTRSVKLKKENLCCNFDPCCVHNDQLFADNSFEIPNIIFSKGFVPGTAVKQNKHSCIILSNGTVHARSSHSSVFIRKCVHVLVCVFSFLFVL